jgi:hypothetical protein
MPFRFPFFSPTAALGRHHRAELRSFRSERVHPPFVAQLGIVNLGPAKHQGLFHCIVTVLTISLFLHHYQHLLLLPPLLFLLLHLLHSHPAPHWSWKLRLSRQNSPTVAREPLETRAGYLTAASATSCTTIPTSSGILPTDLLSPEICRHASQKSHLHCHLHTLHLHLRLGTSRLRSASRRLQSDQELGVAACSTRNACEAIVPRILSRLVNITLGWPRTNSQWHKEISK